MKRFLPSCAHSSYDCAAMQDTPAIKRRAAQDDKQVGAASSKQVCFCEHMRLLPLCALAFCHCVLTRPYRALERAPVKGTSMTRRLAQRLPDRCFFAQAQTSVHIYLLKLADMHKHQNFL